MEAEKTKRIFENIPALYQGAKLSDFSTLGKITPWIKAPHKFLLIIGPTGTGKTHLVCAMAMEFRRRDISTEIVFSSDLFRSLRSSFNRVNPAEPTESQIIERLIRAPILICDDIGVQKQTEYVIEAWYNIIDTRARGCNPTVFTTNLSVKEISEYMSDRVASRLLSGIVVSLGGKDRRVAS